MCEFIIKSANSDLILKLSEKNDQGYTVSLQSQHLYAVREVYAYGYAACASYGLADLIENLALQEQPWNDEKSWESLEWEFKLIATCSALGHVTFKIILSKEPDSGEDWSVKADLLYEFGQLKELSKAARMFFGEPAE